MAEALTRTIQKVVELTRRAGIKEPSHLNLAVSDGNRAVASRFATGSQALAPTSVSCLRRIVHLHPRRLILF
jgi:hypothetical protein